MPTRTIVESKIKRLSSEITRLETKRSNALKDESSALKKISSANSTLSRTKSQGTISSKLREIERENNKVVKAKEDQAKATKEISKKNTELNRAITELSKIQQKEQEKMLKDQEQKVQKLYSDQNSNIDYIKSETPANEVVKEYDVFISHSSDDKDSYVAELASALKAEDVSIWYDSDNIGWGQSIRAEIDKGLANSKYGIVVISPSFIEKYWTNYELDGILNKEGSTGSQMILPIWHNVTADQVQKYSYSLSGKLALNTAINPIDDIVDKVKKLVK